MKNTLIFLDIETIPTQQDDIKEYIGRTIKHPAKMTLPSTIAAWEMNDRQDAIDEAVSKTGLDGSFGQVVVIGYDMRNDGHPDVISGLDEYEVLTCFNSELDSIPRNMWSMMKVVGHNICGFDLRFLMQRYMVNGIRPHAIIKAAVNAKPWDDCVYDTMTQFAGFGKTISLDKLCLALGVQTPKDGMDGSMVGAAVADGRIGEVADYCKKDVMATRAVYQRMTFAA